MDRASERKRVLRRPSRGRWRPALRDNIASRSRRPRCRPVQVVQGCERQPAPGAGAWPCAVTRRHRREVRWVSPTGSRVGRRCVHDRCGVMRLQRRLGRGTSPLHKRSDNVSITQTRYGVWGAACGVAPRSRAYPPRGLCALRRGPRPKPGSLRRGLVIGSAALRQLARSPVQAARPASEQRWSRGAAYRA